MKGKLGQMGFEFMMVVVVAISTLIVFIAILSVLMTNKQEEQRAGIGQSLADGLTKELFFAAEAQEGYTRTINLPSSIEGRPYDLNIQQYNTSSFFELSFESSLIYKSLPRGVQNFYFNSSTDSNIIIIMKRSGNIFLEVVS